MSKRNVELTRRWIEAFNARDVEAQIGYCDPTIEFHSAFTAVDGAVYYCHEGLRAWHQDLQEVWGEEIRMEAEAYFDLGEHTLGFYVLRGRGRGSGLEVANPNASVVRWRDGLATYLKAYTDRADALRDLGVSEDELEPIE